MPDDPKWSSPLPITSDNLPLSEPITLGQVVRLQSTAIGVAVRFYSKKRTYLPSEGQRRSEADVRRPDGHVGFTPECVAKLSWLFGLR